MLRDVAAVKKESGGVNRDTQSFASGWRALDSSLLAWGTCLFGVGFKTWLVERGLISMLNPVEEPAWDASGLRFIF